MKKDNTTLGDWNKKGWAIGPDGNMVKADSLVAKKVEKINPFKTFKENGVTHYDGPPPSENRKIYIKPLSVNACWQGKRFKTPEYNKYHEAVSLLLPNDLIIPDGSLKVYYEFGLSYSGGDWDNPCKPFQDVLQAKYKFNDSRIMEATVKKVIVKKGQEYIKFRIDSL